ncbi:MAG TPA: hypothetical protein RMH99_17500 [Sandaracinaceae bacterium LLY-WYZ-13_1]|nr:hypothetical protein [Sandaracinaceae bacterium LLY-WYZ-13_1]
MDRAELAERYRRGGCLFLDCDGVVFDANAFKVDALRAVMEGTDEAAQREMLDYWHAHGGLSRYVKLDHFFRNVVGLADEAELEAAVARGLEVFGAASRAGYRTTSPVPEALTLVRDAGPARCFVVSGTDQAELRDVFETQAIDDLFAGVLGSPTTKPEHIRRVLAARDAAPDDALFVGDGAGDFRACRETAVPFVYLASMSGWTGAAEALDGERDVFWADDWPTLLDALGVG